MKVKTLLMIILLVIVAIADIRFCIIYGNPFNYMEVRGNIYSAFTITTILCFGAVIIASFIRFK